MNDAAWEAAALLWAAWREGAVMDTLPDECRPRTLAEGYAAQAALAEATGDAIVGWKIAATSVGGQRHIGVDGPLAGRLFSSKLFRAPAAVTLAGNRMRVAEAEFAFVLAADLPARDRPYSRQEVLSRVADLHLAVELPDSRFQDFVAAGAPQLLADDACARHFVIGDPVDADWRSVDLAAHPVTVRLNGAVAVEGSGADVLGDPRDALAWIANNHAAQGAALAAGQVVTTGVCGRPVPVAEGDRVEADFGALGSVSVALTG